MIYGFNKETAPLSEYEMEILMPAIVRGLSTKIGKENAITNIRMVEALKSKGYYSLSGARIRRIINHIRINGIIVNLIASSQGYHIENDVEERRKYVNGVKNRANSMLASLNNIHI